MMLIKIFIIMFSYAINAIRFLIEMYSLSKVENEFQDF